MQYVVLSAQFLIGTVFLVSAMSKLRSGAALAEFAASIRRLDLLRPGWARPAALAVALAEALVPVLVGVAAVPGFLLAGGLLVGFSCAILVALRRGVRVPCRCFGASGAALGVQHVVRNGLLLGVAAAGSAGTALGDAASLHLGGAAVAALAGLVAGAVVVAFDDIVDIFVGSHGSSRGRSAAGRSSRLDRSRPA